jgi:hypothetical protein
VLSATGNSALAFKSYLGAFFGNLAAAAAAVSFGASAVAAGQTFRSHLTLPFSLYILRKGAGIDGWAAVKAILPGYVAAAFMAGCLVALRQSALHELQPLPRLAIMVALGPVFYFGFLMLIGRKFLVTNIAELRPLVRQATGGRLFK